MLHGARNDSSCITYCTIAHHHHHHHHHHPFSVCCAHGCQCSAPIPLDVAATTGWPRASFTGIHSSACSDLLELVWPRTPGPTYCSFPTLIKKNSRSLAPTCFVHDRLRSFVLHSANSPLSCRVGLALHAGTERPLLILARTPPLLQFVQSPCPYHYECLSAHPLSRALHGKARHR